MHDDEQTSADPWAAWRGRISAAKRLRDANLADWRDNVDKRKAGGKLGSRGNAADNPATRESATDATASVNKDWPLTKAKIALLYSQTPEIRPTSEDPAAAQIVPQHGKELNRAFAREQVGAAIEEELADVINASGIGGVIIACEKRTVTKDVPKFDPMVAAMSGMENPLVPVTTVSDIRYPVRRISPANLLIPADFTGSVYDHARWLGYEGSLPWAVAKAEFGLTDEEKEKVCSKDRKVSATLNSDAAPASDDVVTFQEIYYWRHYYHEDESSFTALQRVVLVDGRDEPAIDEEYKGQQRTPDGGVVGVTRNPIQILTLTYISDDPLPPSDSTISRGQVNNLEDSRTQQHLQMKHSIPIRWGDTNRISTNARVKLNQGNYQDIVWTNGPGDRAIGEVARATFPPEKIELDHVIDREITDQWTVGPNQAGGFASGERSAREAGIVERNFQTRIGLERAKVERHVLAIAEVLGGLMALHGQTPIPVELLGSISYTIAVDSTVLLNAEQQSQRLEHLIDRLAQSPFADVRPLVAKWLELNGEDPSQVVIEPKPKPPEPVSLSLKGEDLINPLALAHLMHTQQAPSPEDLAAAIKLLQTALAGAVPIPAPEAPDDRPPRDGESPGMANADWQMAPRMDKRDLD